MTLSDSLLAYDIEIDLFDKAVEDGSGVRILCKSLDAALTLRARMHQARALDRRSNLRLYEKGHRMYGHSAYDPFMCRIKTTDGKVYLYIEKLAVAAEDVEGLSVVEEEAEPLRLNLNVDDVSPPPEGFKRRV